MLAKMYRILMLCRLKVKRFTQKEIVGLVEDLKDAWLAAFKDFTLFKPFAGEELSDKVSMIEIGLLAAKERLASLIQKIGAMKHEVQQLFELDFMPTKVKSKLKDAIRTRDPSGMIRSHGWEGWLQFALMYRNVSVRTDPQIIVHCKQCHGSGIYRGEVCEECGGHGYFHTTIVRYYNSKHLCAKCGGTGKKGVRIKLNKPITHNLATDIDYEVVGIKDGRPIYKTIAHQHQEHQVYVYGTRLCPRCKGTGKSNTKRQWRFPTTFDLIDVIEMAAIMKALYEHTDGDDGGVCGHIHKEDKLPKGAGIGLAEVAAADLAERMFHNGEMDFFDREHEEGGDINTNPEDRTFALEREFEQEIDDLVTYDHEERVVLGFKPKFFTKGHMYRGPIEVKHIREFARSYDREYLGQEEPFAYNWSETVITKFSDGYGEFQRLILDRIYHGAFEWDPEFYWFRGNKPREHYAFAAYRADKSSTMWARVSIPIDADIKQCLSEKVRKDVRVIEVTLTGDMAQSLYHDARCAHPTHRIMFECFKNGIKYNMPVANRDADGEWHVCGHVKDGYRQMLTKYLRKKRWVRVSARSRGCMHLHYGPLIKKDQTGEVYGVGLPKNCRLIRVDRPFYAPKNPEEGE